MKKKVTIKELCMKEGKWPKLKPGVICAWVYDDDKGPIFKITFDDWPEVNK